MVLWTTGQARDCGESHGVVFQKAFGFFLSEPAAACRPGHGYELSAAWGILHAVIFPAVPMPEMEQEFIEVRVRIWAEMAIESHRSTPDNLHAIRISQTSRSTSGNFRRLIEA